jgi:hypothetical protein
LARYNKRLEDLLDHHLISNEDLLKKKQLGGVGYLINGNMCLGIYDDYLVVRVGKLLADSLIERHGIEEYDPDSDDLNDFILVSQDIYSHSKALQKFIERGIDYTSSLPPKKHDEFQDLE